MTESRLDFKPNAELRILEIGQFCLFKRNLPAQTTLVFTGENLAEAGGLECRVFGLGLLPWLRGATGMAAMGHDQTPVDIHRFRPNVHPQLARAIHSCIEPDVQNRCPSMEAFLKLIRSVPEDGEV